MTTQVSSNNPTLAPSVAAKNTTAAEMTTRPIAKYKPSYWGTRFLDYIPEDEVTQAKRQEQINELKGGVRKQLLAIPANKHLEQITFIDILERLGVAYHFEDEIEEILQRIYDQEKYGSPDDDLHHTALKFRIMRQHSFPVSSDLFKIFHADRENGFEEDLKSDVQGMLSLYEACFLRVHNEDILEEALEFTTTHLKSSMANNRRLKTTNPALAKEVSRALKQPLHRSLPRIEAARFIPVYETYASCNKVLLKFAKMDYNVLQSAHKMEFKNLCKWWNGDLDFPTSLPFIRDRFAESFFWASGIYYEPKYYVGRIICTKMCQILTCIDDMYDAYGTLDELELFTDAIQRWDRSCVDELPGYMKPVYEYLVLDTYEQFEQPLAEYGKSEMIYYAKEELKALCRAYLKEARWREHKYIPSYEEHIENALTSSAYRLMITLSFLGMGDLSSKEVFEWASHFPRPAKATCMIFRLLDDIVGYEFEQSRDHVASTVDCYMRQHGVSSDEACEVLRKKVEDSWKDLNQDMLQSTAVPLPFLCRMLNLTRVTHFLYDGEDKYTLLSKSLKDDVKLLLVDSFQV